MTGLETTFELRGDKALYQVALHGYHDDTQCQTIAHAACPCILTPSEVAMRLTRMASLDGMPVRLTAHESAEKEQEYEMPLRPPVMTSSPAPPLS